MDRDERNEKIRNAKTHSERMADRRKAYAATMLNAPRRIWEVMGAADERMVRVRHIEQDLAFLRAMANARKAGAERVRTGVNRTKQGEGRFVQMQPEPAGGSLIGSSAGECADS